MRINIYAEELTQEVKVVGKKIEDGRQFYAIRLFLKSATDLHHTPNDDDRSAITFWVPWYGGENHPYDLNSVMLALHTASAQLAQDIQSGVDPVTP